MLSNERVLAQIHAYAATVPGSTFARLEEYIGRIFAENAALHAQLAAAEAESRRRGEGLAQAERDMAAAEQREQQARAIITFIAQADLVRDSLGALLYIEFPEETVKHARAWLADRAEQRTPAQEEVQ